MKDRLRSLLESAIPSGSIVDRSIQSGLWAGGIKFSSRFLQILMLIILARLLVPRQFGLVGIALISLSATRNFSKIGLKSALVQRRDENVDKYLDTAWCLEALRGAVIFGVLFALAPTIAGVFDEPSATPLIRVIGLGPLLFGLRNPGIIYFRKDLEFHKEFVYKVSGGFVQFFVGVGYALVSPTVWALVFAYVSADVFRFGLSYFIHDYRPRPSFDSSIAKELIDYGKWITASSVLYFLYREGDDAFVGWFISATALGFYQYAYRIADTPSSEVSEVIASVSFPAFSKLQDKPAELRQTLLATTRVTGFVTIPMSLGIAIVAPSFVPVVLGSEWTRMIRPMQLLALYGLFHSITRNFGSIFKALDRPDILAKLAALRVACIAVLIWPAADLFGIEGVALVVVGVYAFPMLPLDVFVVSRLTQTAPMALVKEWFYPAIAAGIMLGILWQLRRMLEVGPLVELVVLIPSGIVVYTVNCLLFARYLSWRIEDDIRSIGRSLG